MALFTLALLAASPTSLFAQAASAPGSPGQGATTGSASPAQAPGAAQPPTAASASAASVPEPEMDRPFLSFIMPFAALVSVAIVVTVWGLIFLQTSHISELYPLAIDLFVVCLVMLIATVASLRGGRQPRAEVH